MVSKSVKGSKLKLFELPRLDNVVYERPLIRLYLFSIFYSSVLKFLAEEQKPKSEVDWKIKKRRKKLQKNVLNLLEKIWKPNMPDGIKGKFLAFFMEIFPEKGNIWICLFPIWDFCTRKIPNRLAELVKDNRCNYTQTKLKWVKVGSYYYPWE